MTTVFRQDSNHIDQHRRWLSAFDPQHSRNWEKLLNADAEAAMCETAVRRLLEENGNEVTPNEDLTGSRQSPDFQCTHAGKCFFVEVTCIGTDKVTQRTKLPRLLRDWEGGAVGSLVGDVFAASRQKAKQCAQAQHPTLLAVSTFHQTASMALFDDSEAEMLLAGPGFYTFTVDTQTGKRVGDACFATELRSATFLRPGDGIEIDSARSSISAILICGFGIMPPNVRGILHPDASRPLDPMVLPAIRFCRLRDGYESGTLSTEWIS